ncbi:SAM-dependent methyltransferase, partial [Streptosporangium algeriense]
PGGLLAVFAHVYDPPPPVAEAFATVFRKVVPDSPLNAAPPRPARDIYQTMFTTFADGIRETTGFGEPEQLRFDWERYYSRADWLDLLPTTGGLTRLSPDELAEVLEEVGAAIDTLGGGFTMTYTTMALTTSLTT